jgi:tight adherence protein B
MTEDGVLIFVGLVFAAVFLLAQGMIIPVFGESRQTRKRLKRRLEEIDRAGDEQGINSLLREKYLRELSPLAPHQSLPMMDRWRAPSSAGHQVLAHRLVRWPPRSARRRWSRDAHAMPSRAFRRPCGGRDPSSRSIATGAASDASRSMPDVDVMRRALQAGHPFNGALKSSLRTWKNLPRGNSISRSRT